MTGRPRNPNEILDEIEGLAEMLVLRTSRSSQYADMQGEDSRAYYRSIQTRLGRIAGRARRDLTKMMNHSHEWDERGFCRVCGWDGNA